MEVILDPLESRFDKLFIKYTTDQNGVRMKSWRPSQVVSVLQSESSLRDASFNPLFLSKTRVHVSPFSKYDEPELKSELT
jgi:hypothetical protein